MPFSSDIVASAIGMLINRSLTTHDRRKRLLTRSQRLDMEAFHKSSLIAPALQPAALPVQSGLGDSHSLRSQSRFQIHVKTMTGKMITVDVTSSDTIYGVKQ